MNSMNILLGIELFVRFRYNSYVASGVAFPVQQGVPDVQALATSIPSVFKAIFPLLWVYHCLGYGIYQTSLPDSLLRV